MKSKYKEWKKCVQFRIHVLFRYMLSHFMYINYLDIQTCCCKGIRLWLLPFWTFMIIFIYILLSKLKKVMTEILYLVHPLRLKLSTLFWGLDLTPSSDGVGKRGEPTLVGLLGIWPETMEKVQNFSHHYDHTPASSNPLKLK